MAKRRALVQVGGRVKELPAGDCLSSVVTAKLASDHSITSTTATEVTGLQISLGVGTHVVTYYLVMSAAATTTGHALGINFTGTAARRVFMRRNVSTITTASNGLTEEESGAALKTGGVMNAWASKAYSTTAPNMVSDGVGVQNVDTFEIIEVLIEVTVAGDLELWHATEATGSASVVESGSSVIAIPID